MDDKDRQLLNLIQAEFPLVQRPFHELGRELNLSEEDVISRVKRLKKHRIIRQISAIFSTRALGYQSTLVAMKIDPDHIDESAEIISSHPGVSHNYARNHEFNLWFTIAVPPEADLKRNIDRLHELVKAEHSLYLPALKLFKIGVKLDMTGKKQADARQDSVQNRTESASEIEKTELDPEDISAVRQLQEDITLTSRPFDAMAEEVGMTVEQLLDRAEQFQQTGLMRRFAAVLYHRNAGFSANAMGAWRVPEKKTDEVGTIMSSFDAVTHCYQRPTYPDWPYALFTMVHGSERAECEQILSTISEETGLTDYIVIYSTKEYKKTRLRYFTEEFDEWEKKNF